MDLMSYNVNVYFISVSYDYLTEIIQSLYANLCSRAVDREEYSERLRASDRQLSSVCA